MEELERKKNEAIQDVLNAVKKQMQKEGMNYSNMHFEKITFIKKYENGDIEISFPFGKKSYGNRCYITVNPEGKAHINGIQTSPEKMQGLTKKGNFDFELNIENWSETENIAEITSAGYGEKPLPNGILDHVPNELIDEEFLVKRLVSMYPSLLEHSDEGENDDRIKEATGKLDTAPYSFGNFSHEEILCLHPAAAAVFLETILDRVEKGEDDKEIVLFEEAGYSPYYGNTYDINYDIGSMSISDYNKIHVIEKEGIVLQDNDSYSYPNGHTVSVQPVNDEILEKQYNRYKEAVLSCIDNEIDLDYTMFVNEDLRSDKDFIERAKLIIEHNGEDHLDNYYEIVSKMIGINIKENQNSYIMPGDATRHAINDITPDDVRNARNEEQAENLKGEIGETHEEQ